MQSKVERLGQEHLNELRTLEQALQPDHMKDVLTPLMRAHFGLAFDTEAVRVEVLRARNKRCVLRYQVSGRLPNQKGALNLRIVAKVFRPNRGEKVYRNMQKLWMNGFSRESEDGISMPEPLGFVGSLCMLLQEEIPGQPIKLLLKQAPERQHLIQLARTLAKLHSCAFVPGEPFTIRNHLMRCHPKYPFLAIALPHLAESIHFIVDSASELESRFGDIRITPLHGDFHLGQIHLQNGHTWLIDFDALSYGDPAADLGNLLVFIKGKAQRNKALQPLLDAFLEEYFCTMDADIVARIPLYEALTHLRRACKSLRLQKSGWRERAEKMVRDGVSTIETLL